LPCGHGKPIHVLEGPVPMLEIKWHDEDFLLLPERLMLWKQQGAMLLTDPHFGKSGSFRAKGIPIPAGVHADDLLRLAAAIDYWQPSRLVILGDFFHDAASQDEETLNALRAWRAACPDLAIDLVPGNHDRRAGAPPADLRIAAQPQGFAIERFRFFHAPPLRPVPEPSFAGHLHPGIKFADPTGTIVRAPCFYMTENTAILPAFGSFTGTGLVLPQPGDRVFMIGPEHVLELPTDRIRFRGV